MGVFVNGAGVEVEKFSIGAFVQPIRKAVIRVNAIICGCKIL